MHLPESVSVPIAVNLNPDATTYWKTDYHYFDQQTGKELSVTHQWGRFQKATSSEKLMRMNYNIHVGAIAGLPGKIFACLMSLVIASLPITGFLVWYGRRYKPGIEFFSTKFLMLPCLFCYGNTESKNFFKIKHLLHFDNYRGFNIKIAHYHFK